MCSIYYECVSAARYNVPIINIKEYRMSSNFINYLCVMWKLATFTFIIKIIPPSKSLYILFLNKE